MRPPAQRASIIAGIAMSAMLPMLGMVALAPDAQAYPACLPGDSKCCPKPSCPDIDQDFIQGMLNMGIANNPVRQSIPGLISGARNTVCPRVWQGVPSSSIMADLQQYSGFTQVQAIAYVNEAVTHYCSNQFENLVRNP